MYIENWGWTVLYFTLLYFTLLLMWCSLLYCAVWAELIQNCFFELIKFAYCSKIIYTEWWSFRFVHSFCLSRTCNKKDTSNLDVSTKYISLILFHRTCHIEKSIGWQQHSVAVACTCFAQTQLLLVLLLILVLSFDSFWNDTQMFLHVL